MFSRAEILASNEWDKQPQVPLSSSQGMINNAQGTSVVPNIVKFYKVQEEIRVKSHERKCDIKCNLIFTSTAEVGHSMK